MQQKIVLIGGPGTGKTSVINELINNGLSCKKEISRQVTLDAKAQGIDQLFITSPLLFSEMLLKSREQQFIEAHKSSEQLFFFDRGIPDVEAYLRYAKTEYPSLFSSKSKEYRYDLVFLFEPWKEIYTKDNERYETFEEALLIHQYLKNIYKELNYTIINVPFASIKERTDFILKKIAYLFK